MSVAVRWLGINALEFRHSRGSFMIDPYVSRNPVQLTVSDEVDRYLHGPADFILMTHSHWDHLPDVPRVIAHSARRSTRQKRPAQSCARSEYRNSICTN